MATQSYLIDKADKITAADTTVQTIRVAFELEKWSADTDKIYPENADLWEEIIDRLHDLCKNISKALEIMDPEHCSE